MKRILNILALLVLPFGFAMGQTTSGGQAKTQNTGVAVKLPDNVKPIDKTKVKVELKSTSLPSNVKPIDKSKTPAENQKGPPMPQTSIPKKN